MSTQLTLDETTITVGIAAVMQIALMVQLARAQRTALRSGKRVEQLTAALELLTDTAEAGFVNVATELERVGARPMAAPPTRRAITQRIVAAVRQGQTMARIAASEGLSESEVRLHIGLAQAGAGAASDDEPESDASVLVDLEQWMSTLALANDTGGPRDAAMRV